VGGGGGCTYRDNRFTAQTMHLDQSNKAYRRHGPNIICEQLTYIKLIHWESYANCSVEKIESNFNTIRCQIKFSFLFSFHV